MRIRGMKDNYKLILAKMNEEKLGIIPSASINNISKGIKSVSEMNFIVNKYYGTNNYVNILYDEIKNERFIFLDEDECYVIKNVSEINENKKEVTAYSRDKKLFRITAEFEDITLTLKTPYEDIEGCYSLDELLYNDTGWHIGYVSPKVLYKSNETELDILNGVESSLTNEEKLRYQENVSTNWYDYIDKDISEQFECYPFFNSYDKTIDLYSDDELGEDPNLILSYDNYLKSLEKITDTEDIITKLILVGNDDLDILESNPSGERFIEDFSYFMNCGEMSSNLINALKKYLEITKKRSVTWYSLITEKRGKDKVMIDKKNELLVIYSQIKSLEYTINGSTDELYIAQQRVKLQEKNDERVFLENEIDILNTEITNLNESILNINKLCKKQYATDDSGILIFNNLLLDELKNFIYQDTYDNENITDSMTLMKIGKKRLEVLREPTVTWNIDVNNFIERLEDNGFRQHWRGELGLGDMIVLKGNEIIDVVYLVGYTQDFENKTIELKLSNKKSENEFSLTIGERLTQSKEAYKLIRKNISTINRVSKYRYGLNYDKINKTIL